MAASSYADQLAATKARREADVAARKAREQAQADKYRAQQPIPIYGVGKGMDVYYRPGQSPGAERTEARGREVSGYWDPRTNKYVPSNWQRPTAGQVLEQDGRIYQGGPMSEEHMPRTPGMPVYGLAGNWWWGADGKPTQQRPGYAPDTPPIRPGVGPFPQSGAAPQVPPSGSVPLPPGQGPVPLPPAGAPPAPPAASPYIGMPPPIIPPGGNKIPQSQTGAVPLWFHLQNDPMALQEAQAQALRTG